MIDDALSRQCCYCCCCCCCCHSPAAAVAQRWPRVGVMISCLLGSCSHMNYVCYVRVWMLVWVGVYACVCVGGGGGAVTHLHAGISISTTEYSCSHAVISSWYECIHVDEPSTEAEQVSRAESGIRSRNDARSCPRTISLKGKYCVPLNEIFTSCSLQGAESNGLGPRKLRRSLPPLFAMELATSTETGWLRPTRWGFVCKMSLKAPFRSYKSTDDRDWPIYCSLLDTESTGFGPKRLRCSVRPLFPIEHGWVSGHVHMRTPVAWSSCLQTTILTPRFNSKVQSRES